MRAPLLSRRLRACAAAACLAVACDEPPPAPSWPAGTVLALNGRAISMEEVDEVAGWYAMLEPQFTLPQLRRLALANSVLPLAAARTREPARRTEALREAEALRVRLAAGETPDDRTPTTREGGWTAVGLESWRTAIDLPIGTWSPVVESPGAFHVFLVTERGDARTPRDVPLVLRVYDFGYLDPSQGREALQNAIDGSELTFVDDSWRDFVPAALQHRLRGGTP